MKIHNPQFDRAITRPEQSPEPRPSVIFAGRSNVGKSSLLNRLVGRRSLARTSSTPGRTREIHFYDIDGHSYFIDLPGYGYAKVSKAVKMKWAPMMRRFFRMADGLRLAVVILDVRRDPTLEDRELMDLLLERDLPFIFAVTKCDKLGRAALGKRLAEIRRALDVDESAIIPVSAETGAGVDDLMGVISALLDVNEAPAGEENKEEPR